MSNTAKPKLVFFRFCRADLPPFILKHLREQERCLSQYFDVKVINESCDYKQICELHEPDIAMFDSGAYSVHKKVDNVSSYPTIPKLGLIQSDPYCHTRKQALVDMARWEISTLFTISVPLGSYTPSIADNLFVWPTFIDTSVFHDYGFPKVIPVLFTGSQAPYYPWRSRIDAIVSQHYPALHTPHFGWFWKGKKRSAFSFLEGEQYAQLINASWVAPSCGTTANEFVRKHMEIPACNTCLLTQKSATLQAAGYADLVNCVFADEHDVLDKLDWLFQHPEELERIIQAGKQLVETRHTMQHRDQVFQWYNLHKTLPPGQKIVQPGPFLPLTTVDQSSGISNGHVMSGGIDQLLMDQADEKLWSRQYNEAETLYRRCLNYHYQSFPEPKLKLVLCLLFKGNSELALDTVKQLFPPYQFYRFRSDKDFEPDPTEWACFIIALLCRGKRREATLRASQFPTLHNEQLDRVCCVVRWLNGDRSAMAEHGNGAARRASLHQLPDRTFDEWLEDLGAMLQACGQTGIAERLARRAAVHHLSKQNDHCHGGSAQNLNNAVAEPKTHGPIQRRNGSTAKGTYFKNALLRYYITAVQRLGRSVKKFIARFPRILTGRTGRSAHDRLTASTTGGHQPIIVRLLQKEQIRSAVLLGASNKSWLAEAFMTGIRENPNSPSAVCVGNDTPEFRTFQQRFAEKSKIEFKHLRNGGGGPLEEYRSSDLLAIHCSEICENAQPGAMEADLVLLDAINSRVGYEIFGALLYDQHYVLVVHEPNQCDGYAVFRRVVHQVAHKEAVETATHALGRTA